MVLQLLNKYSPYDRWFILNTSSTHTPKCILVVRKLLSILLVISVSLIPEYKSSTRITRMKRNPAYGRHWLSQRMQIVALIPRKPKLIGGPNILSQLCYCMSFEIWTSMKVRLERKKTGHLLSERRKTSHLLSDRRKTRHLLPERRMTGHLLLHLIMWFQGQWKPTT